MSAESLRATPCFNRVSRRRCRPIARAPFSRGSSRGRQALIPYASAVSDVYQDLFGEGSYTGKGIYDVDAFEAALAGRVPENALLSHDLFEGIFARAGLVTDIEFFEEFPSHYEVAVVAPSIAGRAVIGSCCRGSLDGTRHEPRSDPCLDSTNRPMEDAR